MDLVPLYCAMVMICAFHNSLFVREVGFRNVCDGSEFTRKPIRISKIFFNELKFCHALEASLFSRDKSISQQEYKKYLVSSSHSFI